MNQFKAKMILLWILASLNTACALTNHKEQTLTLPDGSVYSGALSKGMLSGAGRLVWLNGDIYDGQFSDGLLHGIGTLTTAAGDVYQGNFQLGELTGKGEYVGSDGTRYQGEFLSYQFNGGGELVTSSGDIYRGDFELGELLGLGTFNGVDGSQYAGEFVDSLYDGLGVWEDDESRYTGEFLHGYFHGFGERVDVESGEVMAAGEWQYGRFKGPAENAAERLARQQKIEQALFDQPAILAKALDAVAPQNPNVVELYPVIVAGDGTQDVFSLEAKTIQALLDEKFSSNARTLMMGNHPDTMGDAPLVTGVSLPLALQGISQKMDPQQDILLLYLTSHGSSDHKFYLATPGHKFLGLAAQDLAQTINDLPVKWKVIIVSACYSGGFIEPLKAPEHLIITAARDDRTSFGCSDEDTMTYFGRAFFEQALPAEQGFVEAFYKARVTIAGWEEEQSFEHSEPQIFIGSKIEGELKKIMAK
ncbi:C13 family peptidase [Gilvimarinus polysaccharolyticus]|uniref:C13 family peptidase n=1 Tax=Gilvimarinus polysaccharolyticus TaxID=863921 RepID=UPI0006732AB0|nr:C13 family peptidase [Gilvimarinus polysaccharolyticus]